MRSPLSLMGGKHYLAERIVAAFPPDNTYDAYIEPFVGSCSVLLRRPPGRHIEIVSDKNANLVSFLLQLRDNVQALAERCDSLPYSRQLYYEYHASLNNETPLEALERATRWFYVMRSGILPAMRKSPVGWACSTSLRRSEARSLHSAIALFEIVSERLKNVHIDNRDFTEMLSLYGDKRAFFYCDPPYLEAERYYSHESGMFTLESHEVLARVLNNASRRGAKIALSYYDRPELEAWYPPDKWRRQYWDVPKHSQRGSDVHSIGHEVLLMNYDTAPQLWAYELAESLENTEAWLYGLDTAPELAAINAPGGA